MTSDDFESCQRSSASVGCLFHSILHVVCSWEGEASSTHDKEGEGERLIDRSIMQTRLGEAFGVNTYWMAFRSWMVEISDISIDFSCCFSWRGGIVVLMDGWIRHASLNLPYKSSHIRNSDSMAVFPQMPLMRRTGDYTPSPSIYSHALGVMKSETW